MIFYSNYTELGDLSLLVQLIACGRRVTTWSIGESESLRHRALLDHNELKRKHANKKISLTFIDHPL